MGNCGALDKLKSEDTSIEEKQKFIDDFSKANLIDPELLKKLADSKALEDKENIELFINNQKNLKRNEKSVKGTKLSNKDLTNTKIIWQNRSEESRHRRELKYGDITEVKRPRERGNLRYPENLRKPDVSDDLVKQFESQKAEIVQKLKSYSTKRIPLCKTEIADNDISPSCRMVKQEVDERLLNLNEDDTTNGSNKINEELKDLTCKSQPAPNGKGLAPSTFEEVWNDVMANVK